MTLVERAKQIETEFNELNGKYTLLKGEVNQIEIRLRNLAGQAELVQELIKEQSASTPASAA